MEKLDEWGEKSHLLVSFFSFRHDGTIAPPTFELPTVPPPSSSPVDLVAKVWGAG